MGGTEKRVLRAMCGVRMKPQLKQRLEAAANRTGCSVSELLHMLTQAFVDRKLLVMPGTRLDTAAGINGELDKYLARVISVSTSELLSFADDADTHDEEFYKVATG